MTAAEIILILVVAAHITRWLLKSVPQTKYEAPIVEAIGKEHMDAAINEAKRIAFGVGAKYPSNVTTWPDRMERVEREVSTFLLRRGIKCKKRIVHWIVVTAVNAIGDN